MATTTRVAVQPGIQVKANRPKPYVVRWTVAGRGKSRSFAKRDHARRFQADLRVSADARTPFDTETGEPASNAVEQGTVPTVLEFARTVVAEEFDVLAGKSNEGIVQGLATTLPHLVVSNAAKAGARFSRPAMEHAVQVYLTPGDDRALPAVEREALRWLQQFSSRLDQVSDEAVKAAMGAAASRQDGVTPASEKTYARKRSALSKVFSRAVLDGHLAVSPLRRLSSQLKRQAATAIPVDAAEVAPAPVVREVLAMVTNPVYRLFLAVVFYAGLRPEEVRALCARDVTVTEAGRVVLLVRRAAPEVRKRYSATGTAMEDRPTKHRRAGQQRRVPVPRLLGEELLEVVASKSADALVVATRHGTPVNTSNVGKAWREARAQWVVTQHPAPSALLLRTPYTLRHCAATLWLQAGLPPIVVAARLGHSVQVLLDTYAAVMPHHDEDLNVAVDGIMG